LLAEGPNLILLDEVLQYLISVAYPAAGVITGMRS
jgi:hypothetical protein